MRFWKEALGVDAARQLLDATATLDWHEQKKPDDAALKDRTFDSSYTLTLRNQARFVFEIAKGDNKDYIKASATFAGDPKDKKGGCGCAATPQPLQGVWLLAMFGALGLRRRR